MITCVYMYIVYLSFLLCSSSFWLFFFFFCFSSPLSFEYNWLLPILEVCMADNFVQLKTKLGKCRVPVIQHNFSKVRLQKFYLSMGVLNYRYYWTIPASRTQVPLKKSVITSSFFKPPICHIICGFLFH